MKINIRKTEKSEYYQTEFLTRETFWNLYKPGCNEHLILNKLRKSSAYIKELDLSAVHENEPIGHVISSKAKIVDTNQKEHEILCLGPLTVMPGFQNKGIGSMLLNESMRVARQLCYRGIILFGNPAYYQRFGFVNAKKYGIATKDDQNFEAFMALEMNENSLLGVNGRFLEDPSFLVEETELMEFEKLFPFKEKQITETQFKH